MAKQDLDAFYNRMRKQRAEMGREEFVNSLRPVSMETHSQDATPNFQWTPPKKNTFWDDVKAETKTNWQMANPFDDVSWKEAARNFKSREKSDSYLEADRFTKRALDSAAFGLLSNLEKKVTGNEADYKSHRSMGEGGVTDFISTGLGYLVPGTGALKLLRGTKLGANMSKTGLSKLAQIGKEGAVIGGGIAGAEVGVRESLNPDDYNWKQNALHVGLGTVAGAVADPLLYGAGKGIQNQLSRFAKGDVPTYTGQPSNDVLERLRPQPQQSSINNSNALYDRLATNMGPQRSAQPSLSRLQSENIAPSNELTRTLDEMAVSSEARLPKSSSVRTPSGTDDIKDITQFQVGTTNLYRLADRLPPIMGNRIKQSLDTAKNNYVDFQKQLTDDLHEKVVKGLGIRKNTKESALVQDFGEKTLGKKALEKNGIDPNTASPEALANSNLQALKELRPKDWQKIVAADGYFRQNYDRLIDEVNRVRAEIYPRNPEKQVPKRQDYYHHFNELEGFEGVKNLFETPANIDPHLEGVSPFTRPRTKFQGFMQRRGLGPYKSDAVGGYLKYLKASSHSINIDPVIPVLQNVKKQLADATTDTRNANKIIETLEDYSKDLAGKTNPYDRLSQKVLSRKGMALLNWFNGRIKSNMILGNLSSALGQLGNVPLGIGRAKLHAVPGLLNTVKQTSTEIFTKSKNAPIHKSQFLKERYSDILYRRFDDKLINQPKRMAVWLLETADKSGTRFIWNSMYAKGVKEGVPDPIKYADYETRNVVAGRGVGEVPMAQKSKTVQVFAPFTLEVGNQWRVLKDMVGDKDAAGIITFLVASYGLNRGVEFVRGSGVSFDPVDAIVEGYENKEGDTTDKALGAVGSLAGEVIGNIPGGNIVTNAIASDKKIPFTETRLQDVFGERSPNRFGSGLILSKAVQNPEYIIMPWGANQTRKSLGGIEALQEEGVYNDNPYVPFTGENTELRFPIDTDNPLKKLQMLALGPNSTSEAQEFYDNDRRKLSEKQTNQYLQAKEGGQGQEFYDNLMRQRQIDSLQRKIKDIQKDNKLTNQEKQVEILRLMAQLQEIAK